MKKIWILSSFILILMGFQDAVCACTSFAVFSQQVYYGMNFDFQSLPMKLIIATHGDIKVFHLAFERCIEDMKFFVNTAGMNTKGLFAACQELHPTIDVPPEKTEASMFTFELYEAIASCNSVEQISDICKKRPLVNLPGITLHNLFADPTGQAMVTEAGEEGTRITENKINYLVMTNFPNSSMAGKKDAAEAEGKGADRYKICHAYLENHADHFTIDHGLELLTLACNQDPQYPTACSMVFDPQQSEVYLAFHGKFSKIWKLSIENQSIETWKGFIQPCRIPIEVGDKGIWVSDLTRL